MVHITRIAGSPGAGKTYKLTQILERERDENSVSLGDFYYITFTNAGREDTVDSVVELFPGSRDDIKGSVKTLHSAALGEARKAGIVEDHDNQIVTHRGESDKEQGIYQEFADKKAMYYNGRDLQDSREKDGKDGTADKLFKLNEWLKLSNYKPKQAQKAPFPVPWNTKQAVKLLDEWEAFKRNRFPTRRFEHMDYLDTVIERGLFPDVSVLLLDEFQDFSPQEYLYYKVWRDSDKLDRVYFAGDPNQSIYSFRAGHPFYFRNTDYDESIELTESHRCREQIADYATRVLNSGPENTVELTSAFDGGAVKRINGNNDGNLKAAVDNALTYDNGGFLLARTNSKVHSIKRWLKANGYPYRILGKKWSSMWASDGLNKSLEALRTLQRGSGGIEREAVDTLMAHAPQSDLRKSLLDTHGDVYSVESVWKAFTDVSTVGQIADKLDYDSHERQALRNAARNPDGNDPDDLCIGTVHTAKGLERPCVLLFNSFNGHIEQQYNQDTGVRAEEHRIAYVGATRASKRLYVVDGFFNGPKMKPLEKARGGVIA